MSELASVEDLLAPPADVETRDVEVAGGKVVTVRGMTRMELMLTRKGSEDPAVIEQKMLAFCLVAPKLTVAQVERWQKVTGPMVIAPVTEAIRELSGLGEGADKSDQGEPGEQ